MLLAALLCIACIPAQSLLFAKEAWASNSEVYIVIYGSTDRDDNVAIIQNTPNANDKYMNEHGGYVTSVPGNLDGLGVEESAAIESVASIKTPEKIVWPYEKINLGMFSNTRTADLHNLDVSKVRDMFCMFQGCYELALLNLAGWNVFDAPLLNHQ